MWEWWGVGLGKVFRVSLVLIIVLKKSKIYYGAQNRIFVTNSALICSVHSQDSWPLFSPLQDVLLAEIVSGEQRDWFVTIREHDSLLENLVEQELTEEEKKAAWEEYENEKKGLRMNGQFPCCA